MEADELTLDTQPSWIERNSFVRLARRIMPDRIAKEACSAATHRTRLPEIPRDLIERCIAREELAVGELLRCLQRPVMHFLFRRMRATSEAEIEELTQEVLVKVFKALPTYLHQSAKFSTWTFGIARNHAIDFYRKRKRRVVIIEDDPSSSLDGQLAENDCSSPCEVGSSSDIAHRLALGQAIGRAVDKLSEEHREVFLMVEYHGVETKEIALMLEIPEATVRSRLCRAREQLQKDLKDWWEGP